MAPMITDSYIKYSNSEFGTKNQGYKQSGLEPSGIGNYYSTKQSLATSMSYQSDVIESNRRRYTSEEHIYETLKGNNYKQQVDLFDELIARVQANTEISPITIRNLEEFYDSIGTVLINTISGDVQKSCLRFLQVYFKSVEKLRAKKSQSEVLTNNFEEIDVNLNNILMPYLINASVSNKLQLKQLSIDLIYTYMKLTDSLNNLFIKFVKYGVENPDYAISKSFMDPTLCIILTDEFVNKDFFQLVKSLTKQLPNTIFESSAIKCLNKIETIVRTETFNSYLNRLPQNLKDNYFKYKKILPTTTSNLYFDDDFLQQQQNSMKFNLIPQFIMQKLSGEDETQRLQAIRQLEISVLNLPDIKSVYPYYQDFISYMNNFVDDTNYEVRLASLKILCTFIEKLGNNVNQCYKVICSCARQVMSQTHQSKPIKQSLNTMLLLTIENMLNPILILECLLDKIKDRNAKAREEFLNIIMAAVLKYPSDKFDPLRKIFFQVASLLCDIKRNVRHAALECIAVIYSKLKQTDKNIGSLLDQLDSNVSEFQHFDNLNIIKDVIMCRVSRNKLPVLNSDMTIDYAIKIPSTIISNGYGNDLDIEWIVSASSSSGSASNLSSARSQASIFNENNPQSNSNTSSVHRMASLDNNIAISTGSFKQRRPSGNKRLPWEETNDNQITSHQNVPKVMRSREVAPLKAFPLTDELDFVNGTLNAANSNMKPSTYPASTSYQEKYLKKLQSNDSKPSKTDSQHDGNETHDTVKRIQNEKAFSLDNLYNIDDNINSENSIQKRKIANLNFKNGIIPSKPTIPRRNSATRFANNDAAFLSNRSNYDLDDEFNTSNQLTTEDFRFGNEIDDSMNKKYDTMPNLRTSAKNRKKLEKLFSYGINNNNSNDYDKNDENNLYLSKLKAEKHNETSRYTPSNPESGVFSMSDYDQIENTNRYSNHQQNGKQNKQSNNITNSESNNTSPLLNSSVPITLDVVSPFNTKPKLLRSTSKSKIDPNPTATNKNTTNSKQEYNPLAGVSFKPTHASDVEIVGVKLVSNSNQENNNQNAANSNNSNIKKKASFQGQNDNKSTSNGDNDDILDIVGRGYNNPNSYDPNGSDFNNYPDNKAKQTYESNLNQYSNQEYTPNNATNAEEIDYPLSLSFRSRLRQKTQEKFEEKQRKKVERIKQQQKDSPESPIIPNLERNTSPTPVKNFGLSISGYQNQVNGKPPIYNNFDQPIYMLEDYPEKKTSYINKYDPNDLINDADNDFDDKNEQPNNDVPARDRPKFKPTNATQARMKAKAAAAAAALNPTSSLPSNPQRDDEPTQQPIKIKSKESDIVENGVYGTVKEDFTRQPFKNPESAYREAMNLIVQDDWEKKCHAMNIIRRLSIYHEDLTVNNIHAIVLVLLPEVKNLRSQVSRFGLLALGDLFTSLKKYMDVDLDMSVKAILQKNSESSDFIRADVEKCLDKMIVNVTTHKGLISLINGGASHRNPTIRRTAAQYIYKCCEVMGPGKILSGIKDVTEKVLITSAQFVVDGPVDIRWYGRKIFHMLMSHDEFDRLLLKYLNETTRKNIKEILDTIRVKGPGEVPTESARNSRKSIRNNTDPISRSAGNNNISSGMDIRSNGFTESSLPPAPITSSLTKTQSNVVPLTRLDPQSQEFIRTLLVQLRNPDFRERIEAIEKFQVACETETDIIIANVVQIFDKFNPSLTDSNSKVNYKALNTMFQIAPILGDNLVSVIANVVPLIAQNLASKNSELQDMASSILDVFIEYLDGGVLIQPFTNIAQHGNVRIRPQIVFKLADLIPHVYSRKQKQVELHILPTLWTLLNSIKGNSSMSSGTSLNGSVQKLAVNLFDQMGEQLIERASNSSSVSSRNLELLKELINASVR